MAADDWIDDWDMDLDYYRLFFFEEAEKGYWVDKHGDRIRFKKMKLSHLMNSLNMLLSGRAMTRIDTIPFLVKEIRKRPGGRFALARVEGLNEREL
jgi:hypothetical protein